MPSLDIVVEMREDGEILSKRLERSQQLRHLIVRAGLLREESLGIHAE